MHIQNSFLGCISNTAESSVVSRSNLQPCTVTSTFILSNFFLEKKKKNIYSDRQMNRATKWKKQEESWQSKIENPLLSSCTASTIPPVFLWINFQGHRVSANISFPKMAITQAITWTTQICLLWRKRGGKDRGYIESGRWLRLLCAFFFFTCQYQETEVGKIKTGTFCFQWTGQFIFLKISLWDIVKKKGNNYYLFKTHLRA